MRKEPGKKAKERKFRLIIEFPEDAVIRLEKMIKDANDKDIEETVKKALGFYEWYIGKIKEGYDGLALKKGWQYEDVDIKFKNGLE
ncbi:hypothetical protein HYX16_03240 [Candidatus Woesearchaeota archaeon]|nr:hypothetical protein [Candidatus Woesearchaeota archaeon]